MCIFTINSHAPNPNNASDTGTHSGPRGASIVQAPAMHIASDNADQLSQELKIQYNKARQNVITNELIDIVGLEKGDFKGLGAADKVVVVYKALLDHKFKFPAGDLAVELTRTNSAKRENHGAI